MNETALHILVVEDQIDLAQNIGDFLSQQGHTLDFASNGKQGLDLALSQPFDLIILDIMLPGIDGLEVCNQLRQKADRHIPVLMLTARDTLQDKIDGFSQGADDYLTKPFELAELAVRCIALSRRHLLQANHKVNIGDLVIDRKLKQVSREGKVLNISHMHYRILQVLAEAYPQAVTRSQLSQKLWQDEPTESDALRSHIYQLRQILDKPFTSNMLKTIHGVGFALDIPSKDKP